MIVERMQGHIQTLAIWDALPHLFRESGSGSSGTSEIYSAQLSLDVLVAAKTYVSMSPLYPFSLPMNLAAQLRI